MHNLSAISFKASLDHQSQRTLQHALALIGGIILTITATVLILNGSWELDNQSTLILLSIFWAVNFTFTLTFITKANLRFKRKSLAFSQMIWAQFCVLVFGYFSPDIHEISMMFSLATLVFGTFGLSRSRFALSVVMITLGHTYLFFIHPPERPIGDQHIILALFFIVTALIASVGSYFGQLRRDLNHQNNIIQKRTTELESTQNQLTLAKEQAEAAARSKSNFLAAASHDLRQPLHALELYIGALSNQRSEHLRRHISSQMQKSAHELSNLLNSLFDISRFDAGIVKPKKTVFNLSEIVDDLELEFTQLSKETKRPLHVRPTDIFVQSDRVMLRRVIRGLVSNALKHANKGRVLVGFRSRGDVVRCEIWDSGEGIAKELQDRVFDEFYQVKNANRDRQQGLGLGLAIIKRICAALNHPLGMLSVENKGTVFWFEIKKAPDSYQAIATTAAVDNVTRPPHPLHGYTVLCIDDEVSILESIVFLLEGWGCKTIAACTVDQATNATLRHDNKPDIIICDYRITENMNGINAINHIIDCVGEPIPALLITGDIDPKIAVEAKSNGIKLLQKPLTPAKLQLHIAHTLRRHHR